MIHKTGTLLISNDYACILGDDNIVFTGKLYEPNQVVMLLGYVPVPDEYWAKYSNIMVTLHPVDGVVRVLDAGGNNFKKLR